MNLKVLSHLIFLEEEVIRYTYTLLNNNSQVILSGSGTSNEVNSLLSGLYVLEVENNLGCTQFNPIEIFDINSDIVFSDILISNSECYGENGYAELNITNQNTDNYIYNWYELRRSRMGYR